MGRPDPSRAVLLVNPKAGTASPTAAELVAAARERGIATVQLGSRSGAELAREAAARGASALGIAGGDGSLAPVAQVALERDLPFVCVPLGTRNHFARDLGIDCDDVVGSLDAFEGVERRVDVGAVNGRVFLNNVSLGVYASFVHHPAHRTKNRFVALWRMLATAAGHARRPLDLSFERADGGSERRHALVLFVGNNEYRLVNAVDFGERPRLDGGRLHVHVVEAIGRRRLFALLARAAAGRLDAQQADEWTEWTTRSLHVEFTRPRVHAAIDGEPEILVPPLELEVRPRLLRVLVPPQSDPESRDGATD